MHLIVLSCSHLPEVGVQPEILDQHDVSADFQGVGEGHIGDANDARPEALETEVKGAIERVQRLTSDQVPRWTGELIRCAHD